MAKRKFQNDDKLCTDFFQKLFRNLIQGAVKVALRGLHGQVEMEKRDTTEDEKLDTRNEVKIELLCI